MARDRAAILRAQAQCPPSLQVCENGHTIDYARLRCTARTVDGTTCGALFQACGCALGERHQCTGDGA